MTECKAGKSCEIDHGEISSPLVKENEELKAQINWLCNKLQNFCNYISCADCPHVHCDCHNHNWYDASKRAVCEHA